MSSAKIKKLEKDISQLLEQILEIKQMARGTYGTVFVTCGKLNCRCFTEGKKHAQTRISWSENGHPVSRTTPKEDAEWLTYVTSEYRKNKKLIKRLTKLQRDLLDELNKRTNKMLEKAKKRKSYLNVNKG